MIINVSAKKAFGLALILLFVTFLSVAGHAAINMEIQYNAGERRDPMTPLIGPDGLLAFDKSSANPLDINIEGIMVDSGGDSVVIINGEVYKTGDTINDANIVQILNDRILLVQEDEEKTIWLREEIAAS